MQKLTRAVDCKTMETLIYALHQVLHRDPKIISGYSKLAESMPNR